MIILGFPLHRICVLFSKKSQPNLLPRPHPQSAGTTKLQRWVGTRKRPQKKGETLAIPLHWPNHIPHTLTDFSTFSLPTRGRKLISLYPTELKVSILYLLYPHVKFLFFTLPCVTDFYFVVPHALASGFWRQRNWKICTITISWFYLTSHHLWYHFLFTSLVTESDFYCTTLLSKVPFVAPQGEKLLFL